MIKRQGLVGCLVLALSVGAFGCDSDDGGGEGSISGVIPGELFVGRTGDVLIIGNNTSWDEGVSVSFGDGITVDSVTVASPTALMVKVTADAGAELGMRDVAVDELGFSGAFELASPVKIAQLQGQTDQGSIAVIKLQNLDFANPFDTTTTGDGFFTPLEYVNIQVLAGTGATGQISSVEPYSIDLLLLTDVTAAAGATDLEVLSGPEGQQQSFRYPAAFEVGAREPQAIASGEALTASIDEPFQSDVFAVSADQLSIINAGTISESPDASPAFAVLPASGSFAEMLEYTNSTSFVADETYYLVYWDGSGFSGYTYQIGADVTPAEALGEEEPNGGRPSSQKPESLPVVVEGASLEDGDEDWIRVVVPAGASRVVHVFTYGDDPLTDPVISIMGAAGTTPLATSNDLGYHENFRSAALSPGTYYVKVFPSEYFDPAHGAYSIAIVLE
jgi:hypothetical protein